MVILSKLIQYMQLFTMVIQNSTLFFTLYKKISNDKVENYFYYNNYYSKNKLALILEQNIHILRMTYTPNYYF